MGFVYNCLRDPQTDRSLAPLARSLPLALRLHLAPFGSVCEQKLKALCNKTKAAAIGHLRAVIFLLKGSDFGKTLRQCPLSLSIYIEHCTIIGPAHSLNQTEREREREWAESELRTGPNCGPILHGRRYIRKGARRRKALPLFDCAFGKLSPLLTNKQANVSLSLSSNGKIDRLIIISGAKSAPKSALRLSLFRIAQSKSEPTKDWLQREEGKRAIRKRERERERRKGMNYE